MVDSGQDLSRKDFFKIAGAVAAGAVARRILPGFSFETTQENVGIGEVLMQNGQLELCVSPMNGIVDIYKKTNDEKNRKVLVNNLVLLVSWLDDKGKIHYNNAEIQRNPIKRLINDSRTLIYKFNQQEVIPVAQPASDLEVLLTLDSRVNDGMLIKPKVINNVRGLRNISIGLGCFYGVYQGVSQAQVISGEKIETVFPEIQATTDVSKLGSFRRFEGATGFELKSVYPGMPGLQLSLEADKLSNTRVDLESRDKPYSLSHENLLQNYRQTSGFSSWIEAGIIYAPVSIDPVFALKLF